MVATALLSPEELKGVQVSTQEEVRSRAAEILQVSPDQVVVRDLLPTDVGFANNKWAIQITADGEHTYINYNVPQGKVITLYGVIVPSKDLIPYITKLVIKKGGEVLDIIDVQKVYNGEKYPILVFRKPIVYDPNETIKLEFETVDSGASTASPVTVQLIVEGYIAEKLGENITSTELQ